MALDGFDPGRDREMGLGRADWASDHDGPAVVHGRRAASLAIQLAPADGRSRPERSL